MGLDYVDIFYSHRADPETPLEETMGALDTAVRQGKALYVGISSYSPRRTEEAIEILRHLGTPLLIHQPSYSMFNRWIEAELLGVLEREGVGCIAFSPLAQGLLTDKYLDGMPEDSRVRRGLHFAEELITPENVARVRGAQRDRPAARPEPGPDGHRLGAARPARDLGARRRLQRRPAGEQRRGRCRTPTSTTPSWPRSTSTPSTARSTSGSSPQTRSSSRRAGRLWRISALCSRPAIRRRPRRDIRKPFRAATR